MKIIILFFCVIFSTNTFAVPDKVADITLSPSPMDFTGPRDSVTPGKIIGPAWSAAGGTSRVFYCGVLIWNYCKKGVMRPNASLVSTGLNITLNGQVYTVFETGVDGIGFVLGLKDFVVSDYIPLTENEVQTYPGPGTNSNVSDLGWNAKVTYVKTNGLLKTGSYQLPAITAADLIADDNEAAPAHVFINPTTVQVSASGCTVLSNNVYLDLGSIDMHSLPTVGSTSPSKSFSVNLSCDSDVSIYATLTDQSNSSNTSSTVSLTSDSTASGVGVQFLFNGGSPVQLGPDSSDNNNLNQFLSSITTAKGSVSLPFQARYLRTSDLKPGTANALASITFSYQ